jgi:tetratricopeptide (TPR) repeat protein
LASQKIVMFGKSNSMDDDRRTEPPFRQKQAKTVRLIAIAVGVGLCLLVAAYFLGRPALSKWRFNRDLKQATQYEQEGDLRSAMLLLEQLNRLHPSNADIRRQLASFYERAGQMESIVVWREAIELDPVNSEGRLGLARSAIRFGDRQTARQALEQLEVTEANRIEYHRLRAGLAFLERDFPAQEEHLTALERLVPDDPKVRLNLAVLRLVKPAGPQARAARETLLELARGTEVRIRAVVELLSDVARRWPQPAPERDAALRSLAEALAPARGPLVELPSQVDHIDRLVAYAMTQPSPTAEDAVSLANWMSLNDHTEAALQWIDSLPESVSRSPVVRTAMTEFALRIRDWPRLQTLLRAGAWGPIPAEAVEQAFRAHRQASVSARSGATSGWSAAVEAAKGSPPALRMLLRLTELWEWPAERRQVLFTIARSMPRENWAWRQLISDSLGRGDGEQVWQVYQEWRRAVPGEPVVQIEAAIMGFLLGRRPVPAVSETAGYLERQPAHAGATVAHALALWRAGRHAEAAAALDALPRAEFNELRYGLARGIVLAETGRAAESEELLDRASREPLLPEERALVVAARERNRATRP